MTKYTRITVTVTPEQHEHLKFMAARDQSNVSVALRMLINRDMAPDASTLAKLRWNTFAKMVLPPDWNFETSPRPDKSAAPKPAKAYVEYDTPSKSAGTPEPAPKPGCPYCANAGHACSKHSAPEY